ncbi:MAG: TolB family protein [Actinomycetota bacterium]
MKPIRPLLVAAATATATLIPFPAEAATERPVRTTPAGEFQPARGPNHFAWEQNTKAQPNHYDVLAQADGGGPVRVNRGRTNAAMGGIDGEMLVYQQYRKGKSDLFLYSLTTGARSRLPKRVNSRLWEYWPSISQPWLLFGRWKMPKGARQLILHNLGTGEQRVLHRVGSRKAFIDPGQVNGDFVVWSTCPAKGRCQVYRYQISSGTRVQLGNPGSFQRAPSVAPDGTVFLSRGAKGCGASVRIIKVSTDGTQTVLTQFPEGLDSRDTFAYTEPSGVTHLYYERFACGKRTGSDIYEVIDPEEGSITIRKDAVPNNAEDFQFDPSPNFAPFDFFLDDDTDPALPNEVAAPTLPTGQTYTISEVYIPSGWELTDLTCTGGGPNTTTAGATATIGLDPGENVVCTFTNTQT